MYRNVVVGKPLSNPFELHGEDEEEYTLFTEERFLPAILVEAGVVKSRSEVRRNKPDLCITLDKLDCLEIKWGKNKIYIIVGMSKENELETRIDVATLTLDAIKDNVVNNRDIEYLKEDIDDLINQLRTIKEMV